LVEVLGCGSRCYAEMDDKQSGGEFCTAEQKAIIDAVRGHLATKHGMDTGI